MIKHFQSCHVAGCLFAASALLFFSASSATMAQDGVTGRYSSNYGPLDIMSMHDGR